ncbi:alpha/beta-hydrolase [Athelia psychrophila]|uniref:Alpha/beta-hydrolase n=1 Tax=Athelia psychrophila TaxID=1759441 RepID=A0A166PDW3_9AGAM|nr:alpha/beta-hydrolase [Fibularhizoctonia sp. CBS 109695]
MPSLAKHGWNLHYLRLQLIATLLRTILGPIQWLSRLRYQRITPGAAHKRITIPSRDQGRSIIVDTYQSEGHDTTKPSPVLVNMHGSGFVLPGLGSDILYCSLVAARTKCIVYDIDYRKAPENPFPAAIHDIEDAVAHLAAHPAQFDAANIFLSGYSAGGNLALSTAAMLGPERVKGVAAFYGSVDLTRHHVAPAKDYATGGVIPPWLRNVFYDSYILPGQPRDDPRISSAFAPAASFPKHVYLACGDADTLYTPGKELVQRLKEAGHADATFEGIAREAHGFDKGAKEGTESAAKRDKMYAAAVDMINRAVGTT